MDIELETINKYDDLIQKHFAAFADDIDAFKSTVQNEKCQKTLSFLKNMDYLGSHELAEVKFLLYFSLIEYLMSEEEYAPFKDWLGKRIKEPIDSGEQFQITGPSDYKTILAEYHAHHGSRKKIKKFFETYLDKKDVLKIIDMLHFPNYQKSSNGINSRTIFCTECTAPASENIWICPGYVCKYKNNSNGLNEDINAFINKLLLLRNNFIHNADWILFPSGDANYMVSISTIGDGTKMKPVAIKEKPGDYFRILDKGIYNRLTESD